MENFGSYVRVIRCCSGRGMICNRAFPVVKAFFYTSYIVHQISEIYIYRADLWCCI